MILTKEVDMLITNRNYNFYFNKGYKVVNAEYCKIKVDDLPNFSHYEVEVCCDQCGKTKNLIYFKYLKNISSGYYSCSNKCSMSKNISTLKSRYNETHQCKIKEVCDKIIMTKIDRGLISYNYESFNDYRRVVNLLTEKNKKYLMLNWDGNDYYDGEYIKENFILHYNDKRYPTIDHKVSVMFAFNNKWTVEEVSSIDNLCITKRTNNCHKSYNNVYNKKD